MGVALRRQFFRAQRRSCWPRKRSLWRPIFTSPPISRSTSRLTTASIVRRAFLIEILLAKRAGRCMQSTANGGGFVGSKVAASREQVARCETCGGACAGGDKCRYLVPPSLRHAFHRLKGFTLVLIKLSPESSKSRKAMCLSPGCMWHRRILHSAPSPIRVGTRCAKLLRSPYAAS